LLQLYILWLENEKNAKKTQQQTYNKSLSFIDRYFMYGRIQESAKERLKDMEYVVINNEKVPEVSNIIYIKLKNMFSVIIKIFFLYNCYY